MATVREHIKQLFSGFNLPLNDSALTEIGMGLSTAKMTDDYGSGNHREVMIAVLSFVPIFLLTPSSYSVSENGHSKSVGFDKSGFIKWYSIMCKRYGIKDELNTEKPKISVL